MSSRTRVVQARRIEHIEDVKTGDCFIVESEESTPDVYMRVKAEDGTIAAVNLNTGKLITKTMKRNVLGVDTEISWYTQKVL